MCVKECVHSHRCEDYPDKCSDDDADDLESLHPSLVVPAHCLEHTPESVAEVEPDGAEPYDVDEEYPDAAECRL